MGTYGFDNMGKLLKCPYLGGLALRLASFKNINRSGKCNICNIYGRNRKFKRNLVLLPEET
jgi:hypothetical protein